MAHINNHANTVHFLDDLATHACDAGIFIFITSRGKKRLVIIGKLHKANAKAVTNFNKPNIIFNW